MKEEISILTLIKNVNGLMFWIWGCQFSKTDNRGMRQAQNRRVDKSVMNKCESDISNK